jgi:hypothetical protein
MVSNVSAESTIGLNVKGRKIEGGLSGVDRLSVDVVAGMERPEGEDRGGLEEEDVDGHGSFVH